MSKAANDVLAERERQTEQEGWTHAHDDDHMRNALALAGACYVLESTAWHDVGRVFPKQDGTPDIWPWEREAWKPKDRRRNLVRAAALLIAEIERLDREAGS